MIVRSVEVTLYAPSARSLKDKRQILRSLIDQVRRQFHVAVAEVDGQDLTSRLVIGIACVSNSDSHARSVIDAVLNWIDEHCEAEIISIIDGESH